MFDFRSGYNNSPIFFLDRPLQFDRFDRTVFGFYNVNAYQDGVAIRRLSSNADLSLVREWVRLCDDNHADSNFDCLPNGDILPQGFMGIHCEDGRNVLVSGTASMKYFTLSYVCGAEVSDVPDQFGRLPSTLPDLITDVIKVAIALGYMYLWIDRYCVPQTDSSSIKSLLIQNMDKIYSQSTLAIIAAATKCPSEGLAGITRPRVVVQEFLQLKSVHLVQWVSNVKNEIKWNTREWTSKNWLTTMPINSSRKTLTFCLGFWAYWPRPNNYSNDPIRTLIAGIAWNFDIKCRNAEEIAAAAMPSRRRVLPSWTWCNWIHASPSLYSIAWKRNIVNIRLMRRDMVYDTALSLEFEDGTVLPWSREYDVSDHTKKAMSMGDVRFIHVVEWMITHFSIPDGSCPDRNSWGLLKCGLYVIDDTTLLWIQKLAKKQTMNGTNNKEYVFKVWGIRIAPMIRSHSYTGHVNVTDIACMMMLLGETSDPATFERIEVFEVFMEWDCKAYGDWREDRVEEIAGRDVFG